MEFLRVFTLRGLEGPRADRFFTIASSCSSAGFLLADDSQGMSNRSFCLATSIRLPFRCLINWS